MLRRVAYAPKRATILAVARYEGTRKVLLLLAFSVCSLRPAGGTKGHGDAINDEDDLRRIVTSFVAGRLIADQAAKTLAKHGAPISEVAKMIGQPGLA